MYAWSEEEIGKTFRASQAVIRKGWKLKKQNYIVRKLQRVQCACSIRHETGLARDEGGTRFSGELF